MAQTNPVPPAGAAISTYRHRVPFYETDAMGIVHHANYIRYLELARVQWLDEYDVPYKEIAAQGIHYATTRVELDYKQSTRFDDVVEISVWLDWVRGASLCMAYELRCDGQRVATGFTVHAAVNLEGRVRRLPKERVEKLRPLAVRAGPKAL
jgi:acyl-CoA thioester hydrolase